MPFKTALRPQNLRKDGNNCFSGKTVRFNVFSQNGEKDPCCKACSDINLRTSTLFRTLIPVPDINNTAEKSLPAGDFLNILRICAERQK